MKCPNCHIGELEYEDDAESESWSDYQGWWTCTHCKAVYDDFTVTGWQQGADMPDDVDDDIDYGYFEDDPDYDDSDYEPSDAEVWE